ncbi:MAG: non-heme iron oxygenase ferredoxin subunit [Ilumatobacter sp.]|nr:non-heme iron oxygenase ferredoxin subunit [Ilumatobacter sp.]
MLDENKVIVRIPGWSSLSSGVPLRLVHGGRAMVVVRLDDEVFALEDRCSHQDVPLSQGEVDSGHRTIECWKHGSRFSLDDGAPSGLPATRPVPTYSASVEGDEIVIVLPASD